MARMKNPYSNFWYLRRATCGGPGHEGCRQIQLSAAVTVHGQGVREASVITCFEGHDMNVDIVVARNIDQSSLFFLLADLCFKGLVMTQIRVSGLVIGFWFFGCVGLAEES